IHLFSVPHGRTRVVCVLIRHSCERRESCPHRASLSERREQGQGSERRRFLLRATTTAGDSKRDARAAGKNRSVPYESWVDRQIRGAIERGDFDNLPGQGKPIKGLNGRDEENWWVKAYLEREQLPLPLPTALDQIGR